MRCVASAEGKDEPACQDSFILFFFESAIHVDEALMSR